jgi:cation diffusion facilitator family transporter
MTELTHEKRYKIIGRVNWVCTAVDALLSIFKLGVGFFARSPALIADGLHSLSDLGTDILALILGNLAKHGPDEDHPYGHARYETMGTAVLGTVLMIVGLGIGLENVQAMFSGESVTPHWLALIAVAVSIISKEALFHFTMRYARLTRSNLLEANAWHSRSDSLSSVVVFVGIICSFAGFPIVEYIAALAVAALIGKMGFTLAWDAAQDLIDRGVSTEQQEAYIATLRDVEDIIDVHLLRSRVMGTDVLIDAHIQVAPTLTVSEAHQINDFATALLKSKHTEITDITLHIDFEADHRKKKTKLDPMRGEIIKLLSDAGVSHFERIYIHYQNNKVNVELVFAEGEPLDSLEAVSKELTQEHDWINSISILQTVF